MQYKGYDVEQASNGHIMIRKDGRTISHIRCSVIKSEEELKKTVDFVLDRRKEREETK